MNRKIGSTTEISGKDSNRILTKNIGILKMIKKRNPYDMFEKIASIIGFVTCRIEAKAKLRLLIRNLIVYCILGTI